MMSRRRFLQMTVSLAGAAAAAGTVGYISGALEKTGLPMASMQPPIWIPTVAEVAEWLEYYKLAVGAAHRRFHDIVLGLADDGDPVNLVKEFEHVERDFYLLEDARREVGWEQGSGYRAGREGKPRENARFTHPSHPGFGWYNYWAIGEFDRRRDLGLPRHGRTLEEEYANLYGKRPEGLVVIPKSAAELHAASPGIHKA